MHPQNDHQLRAAVRAELTREANETECGMWPIVKMGTMTIGIGMLIMAFAPLLLQLMPDYSVSHWCLKLSTSQVAQSLPVLNSQCLMGGSQARAPILSFLQMALSLAVFLWVATLAVSALKRELIYARQYGYQHLLPMHAGYGGWAVCMGMIAAAACLVTYCLWLLRATGIELDQSRPIFLRTETILQALYYAFDGVIFALTGAIVAHALYCVAMTGYCATALIRDKLKKPI